ncbi:hypothetical protein, partial [Klebsiella spallanzanii]
MLSDVINKNALQINMPATDKRQALESLIDLLYKD